MDGNETKEGVGVMFKLVGRQYFGEIPFAKVLCTSTAATQILCFVAWVVCC